MNTANPTVSQTLWRPLDISPRRLAFTVCAAALVAGNLLAPAACHAFALGGQTWLPIYFFTLMGAWCLGWRAGLAAALLSPALNHALAGMPAADVLLAITLKSAALAIVAGLVSRRVKTTGFALLAGLAIAVIAAQLLGGLVQTALAGHGAALRDLALGWPGILLQIAGGFAVARLFARIRRNA
ncbi:MAG: ECF transporter S component [Opitutaceae bacterium]|jgi:hypothetical protein|nr:ECF transporter S component [Opitutaceae bacterium]